LVKDPEFRFDADEALFHPWLLQASETESQQKQLATASVSV